MKTIYITLISILFSFSLFAQSNWWQVNTNTQERINSVIFEDSLIGYAAAGSKILKSTDAGENWVLFHQDSSLFAYSSITLYKDSLFAIGKMDSTFETKIFLIDKSSKNIRSIINANILNNIIRKISSMTDAVWIQSDSEGLVMFKDGLFTQISADSTHFNFYGNNVLIVSNDKVYTSIDRGMAWDTLSMPFYSELISHSFYNGSDTLIMSYGDFPVFNINSYDKGITWNYPNVLSLSSLYYINGQKLFGVKYTRSDALVYTSSNRGMSYIIDTLGLNKSLNKVYHFSSNLAFVYGENGVLFKTTNLGGLVGINEKQGFKESDFTIFPNPSQDYLQIELADKNQFSVKQMTILSTKGTILDTFQTYQERIELGKYAKGMYVIQIQTDKGSASKSFLVK